MRLWAIATIPPQADVLRTLAVPLTTSWVKPRALPNALTHSAVAALSL